MPSPPAIPPLLANHLTFPPESPATLLTSVLGASSNWLVLRFLYAALSPRKPADNINVSGKETNVVLVSWLRDFAFWREGAKKLGIDLTKASRFTFIDGLGTGLGLKNEGIQDIEAQIVASVSKLKNDGSRVMVILDGLDFLLAATDTSVGEILDCIGELREVLTLKPSCEHLLKSSQTASLNHPYPFRRRTAPTYTLHAA